MTEPLHNFTRGNRVVVTALDDHATPTALHTCVTRATVNEITIRTLNGFRLMIAYCPDEDVWRSGGNPVTYKIERAGQ